MEKLSEELRASEEVGIKDEQLEITCVEKILNESEIFEKEIQVIRAKGLLGLNLEIRSSMQPNPQPLRFRNGRRTLQNQFLTYPNPQM